MFLRFILVGGTLEHISDFIFLVPEVVPYKCIMFDPIPIDRHLSCLAIVNSTAVQSYT